MVQRRHRLRGQTLCAGARKHLSKRGTGGRGLAGGRWGRLRMAARSRSGARVRAPVGCATRLAVLDGAACAALGSATDWLIPECSCCAGSGNCNCSTLQGGLVMSGAAAAGAAASVRSSRSAALVGGSAAPVSIVGGWAAV